MKIKNRVLHVKERPLRGENPSAEGGGELAQFTLSFFFFFFLFRILLSYAETDRNLFPTKQFFSAFAIHFI